jgi:flagellar biosynthesis protein FliQ
MLTKKNGQTVISIPGALKLIGIIAGTWGILVVLTATLAYLPEHPDFSLFTTYLSDIGDTAGWPQILFNSGTLIAAPIRYLVIVLIVLRLTQLGAGPAFAVSALIIGFVSSSGTVLMTATPFSVSPSIHKSGIPLYFFGVVILQTLIFVKEWSLKHIPKVLPILSLLLVVVYFVFAMLVMLNAKGIVSRSTPVIWEWMCFITSIVWVFAQSILLANVCSAPDQE